jgi:hypothetical protein
MTVSFSSERFTIPRDRVVVLMSGQREEGEGFDMHHASRLKRGSLLLASLAAVAAFVLVPTAAQADPSYYSTPLFGSATTPDGRLLVADAGQGIVDADTGALVASLPGVTDVAAITNTSLWAITAGQDTEADSGQALWRVENGVPTMVTNLFAFEEEKNPHPESVDSNPFDVLDFDRGRALVADAGGNSLVKVERFGRPKLVAVLPDELVSTDNIKELAGCPAGPADFCDLPPMIPAQPVATSAVIGPDGWIYAGELKGFPAPTGESRVWRIRPNAENVRCGKEPGRCSVATASRPSSISPSGPTASSTSPSSTTRAGPPSRSSRTAWAARSSGAISRRRAAPRSRRACRC